MTAKNQIPCKVEKLLERDLGDEIVVLSPEGRELHSFEGSASFIWGKIDGQRTVDEILAAITEEYQVEPADAQSDLELFIAKLKSLSLIILC
jgi:hypothetical protein